MRPRFLLILSGLFILAATPRLDAQTSLSLLAADGAFDLNADVFLQSSETDAPPGDVADPDVTIAVARSRLRYRPDPDGLAFGHEYTHLDLNSDDTALPERLIRHEAAVGLPLGEVDVAGRPWDVGLIAGGGYAGTNAYGDASAYYGLGVLYGETVLGNGATLLLGVTYDGNRSVLPDTPLPLVQYRQPLTEEPGGAELGLLLGYPESRITYRPSDRLTLSAGLSQIDVLSADVTYQLTDAVALLGAYGGFYDQFYIPDGGRDRFYFVSQRLELGVKLTPAEGVDVTVTGGYAFAQELRRGYDWRETDVVREFDPAPLVRLAVRVGF